MMISTVGGMVLAADNTLDATGDASVNGLVLDAIAVVSWFGLASLVYART